MIKKQLEILDNIAPLVGNTPLLEIHYTYKGKERRLFAKLESGNLSGSVKDRIAHHILKTAYMNGSLKPGDKIVEATSGNTGITFSAFGSLLGHPVTIFMPDWMSRERVALMESYGANVRLVTKEEGGFTGSVDMAENMGLEEGVFLPRQFTNVGNTQAHILTTGQEIIDQLGVINLVPDITVAGVGTGGTVMGLNSAFKKINPSSKVFALEPTSSAIMSTGHAEAEHIIYGIGDGFIPDLCKLDELDGVVVVDEYDSTYMARMLSEVLGLSVGISSGANFLGAVLKQDELGSDHTVVTVFADDAMKYLSTDYGKKQVLKDEYVSGSIHLLGVKVHP